MDKYVPADFAEEIRKLRYASDENETFDGSCERVASEIAKIENKEKKGECEQDFYDILSQNLFSPGGRIWFGAGKNRAGLLNCYVVPTVDSREGWGQLMANFTAISGTGGGVGMNFSTIRPNGSLISSSGGTASGPVSLMSIIDKIAEVIKGGGGRRAACLFALSYKHPDVFEFLDKKLNLAALTNANVSILIDEDFIEAVRKDEEIQTEFAGKPGMKYSAKALFQRLIDNSVKTGEPGILNLGLANYYNNHGYAEPLVVTNPCGELFLPPNGACDLGSLILPSFINDDGSFNFELLGDTIPTAVRLLDNVLDITTFPIPAIEIQTKRFRRVGLGVMGVHDMLLLMGYKYDSEEAFAFMDKLMCFIKKKAYEASTYLAVEKGCFPEYNRDLYLKANFIKEMPPSIRSKIRQHGIRNSALLTLAPTGTTSIVAGCSGGIEPIYAPAFVRRYNDNSTGEVLTKPIVHPLFKKFIKEGRSVDHFQGAMDISPESHLKMQSVCQKHIDGSISKTINLPANVTGEGMFDLVLKYISNLKGLTMYRDGSRGASPLTPLSLEEAKVIALQETSEEILEHKCSGGSCSL